jgi:hypothetical protein
MSRQRRIEYEGAIHHVLSRGNRREAILLDDADRHDFLQTLAEARRRGEMKRRGWKEAERRRQLKSDCAKWAPAARLRRETSLTLGNAMERLLMGSKKSVSSELHHWRKHHEKQT